MQIVCAHYLLGASRSRRRVTNACQHLRCAAADSRWSKLGRLPIPGQSADLILPCVTKEELASIIKDFAKGDAEKTNRALDALKRAEKARVMLTPETAMLEKE